MSLALGQIGFFQITNLIRNKVPFTLLAVDLNDVETSHGELNQLMAKAIAASSPSFLEKLTALELPKEQPIVLLCKEGALSLDFSKILESKGFLNVYHVKGGWQGLLIEAQKS